MLILRFQFYIKHDTSTKHWTHHLLLWPTKLSYRPGDKGFERYLGRFSGLVCVTHPWSQKAISGMSNCQHRGAIASPWIGHAFHCPSYWFPPQDLFDGFNIFNIVNISLPLILIPATRSVWRFKYFQFRDETGINICAVLEMELASDHFIQWWSYLLVVIFFPSWRSYCRWSWKLCGDKILHNYASASSWESVHYMTLLPYYTISSHYHPIIPSLIINRRITLMM